MNGKRPSPRTIRIASAGTAAAALLAAFAAVAGAGLQSTSSSASEYEYGPGSHQYGQKVTLCHHTHSKKHPWVTITVGSAAVAAHLKHHGDTLGACPAVVPAVNGNKHHGHKGGDDSSDQNTQGNSSSSGNGNSGSHGKSGDHGNSSGHGNNGHGK